MARTLSKDDIEAKWASVPKNWYDIYQWSPTTGSAYMEWLAARLTASFPQIQLDRDGLRTPATRKPPHRGQISLRTSIDGLNEKHLVRGMFNKRHLPFLGKAIDYEIPLKATKDAKHGDIDLLCITAENEALCTEVKRPTSHESILKAVLQAYTYTLLLAEIKQDVFADVEHGPQLRLTPAILTFSTAQSGRQLEEIERYPELRGLIQRLNVHLLENGLARFRFFLITNPIDEMRDCLVTKEIDRDVKPVFRDSFELTIKEVTPR